MREVSVMFNLDHPHVLKFVNWYMCRLSFSCSFFFLLSYDLQHSMLYFTIYIYFLLVLCVFSNKCLIKATINMWIDDDIYDYDVQRVNVHRYETSRHVWVILEYCTGGDLVNIIRQDLKLPEHPISLFAHSILLGQSPFYSLSLSLYLSVFVFVLLFQYIYEYSLLLSLALSRALSVCLGLQHVHANGFIHGSLKPSNLLINEYGMIKLSGFGLSTAVPTEEHEAGQSVRRG